MKLTVDEAKLDALLAPHDSTRRPGVAVGVARDGVPVYRRWLGLADVGVPAALAPGIRMRIGSTTKHFTCLCIMLLAEDGKLDPSDSVRKHIPELKAWADDVTLARIMSHTAGVRCSLDVLTLTNGIMGKPLPHNEQVKLLAQFDTPNFAPGDSWMYSNGGYVLLTEIIRRLSGTSFEQFLQERVLTPAGLHDTFARPSDTDIVPYTASLHMRQTDGTYRRGLFGPDIGGEGNMLSTVDDMLRWLHQLDDPVVGNAATWQAMRQPALIEGGGSTHYGFGLVNGAYRGTRVLYHTGGVIGGTCQMLKALDLGLDVIAMTNSHDAFAAVIVNQILDECIEGLEDKLETRPGAFPTGAYRNQETGRFVRLAEQDGGPAIDLHVSKLPVIRREDGSAWLLANMADGVTVRPDGSAITIEEYGKVERLEPVADASPNATAAIAGDWRATEVQATATVTVGEPDTLAIRGEFSTASYTLIPQAKDVWLLIGEAGPAGQLEHDGGGLLLSSPSTRRLRFEPAPE